MQRGTGRGGGPGGQGVGRGVGQGGRAIGRGGRGTWQRGRGGGRGSGPPPGQPYQSQSRGNYGTHVSQPDSNQLYGTTQQPSIQQPDRADDSVAIEDDVRRWPPQKIVSGPCPSPLDDLEPTAATAIADYFYNKGSQAEEVWGPPIDATQLNITEMNKIEKTMAEEELRLRDAKDTATQDKLAKLKLELVKDKLHDKQRQKQRRQYGRELINNAWCFQEFPLWLQGVPKKQPWDPDWDILPTNRIGRAPEARLIRIPYNSDIPRIPDIPQDATSQQTAWIMIMRHLFPDASTGDVAAVLNRIWYGPHITYYMTVRIRIEGPPNPHQLVAQQMRDMVQSQTLLNNDQASEWMAKLQASKNFIRTFPNPTIPGATYEWHAGFECVVKKINDAAERVDIDGLKEVSKIPDEFWDVENYPWID
ncbi:MAG: hypothetical protein Q9208_005543 [Pyrenodesmia sp. 3 TL-2023]